MSAENATFDLNPDRQQLHHATLPPGTGEVVELVGIERGPTDQLESRQ